MRDYLDQAKSDLQSVIGDPSESENRALMTQDCRFAALDQWLPHMASMRNIPGYERPCFVFDKTQQHIMGMVNDIRLNMPSVKARPVDDRGDKKTAEIYAGLLRDIESRSNATVAYLQAAEDSITIGRGFFRVLLSERDMDPFSSDLAIGAVHNPFSVYLDPMSVAMDGSDARYCTITEMVDRDSFEQEYPEAKASSIETSVGDWEAWFGRDHVRVAEHMRWHYVDDVAYRLNTGETTWKSDYERAVSAGISAPQILKEKPSKRRFVKWCKHTGAEILEEVILPTAYIPVIPVYGVVRWVDGRRVIHGAIRPVIDPQRALNYWASIAADVASTESLASVVGAKGQFRSDPNWKTSHQVRVPILEYDPVTVGGNVVPPPHANEHRGVPQGIIEQIHRAEHDIEAAFGRYAASLGAKSNEKSGVAIRERKIEGDQANAHYSGNLQISVQHAGRILIELIPHVIARDKVARIIGADDSYDTVHLDPQMSEAYGRVEKPGGGYDEIYNLNVGRYDVVATVGASHQTRRQEALDALVRLAEANPQVMQIAGDVLVQAMDGLGRQGDKIAERLKRAMPPEIVGQEEDGQEMDPAAQRQLMLQQRQFAQREAQYQQHLQMAEQAIGELKEAVRAKDEEARSASAKAMDAAQESRKREADTEIQMLELQIRGKEASIKEYDSQTRRIDVLAAIDQAGEKQAATAAAAAREETGDNGIIEAMQGVQACMEAIQALTDQVSAMSAADREPAPAKEVRAVFQYDAMGRIQGAELSPVQH